MTVPTQLFKKAKVPHDKETDRGRRLAERYLAEELQRLTRPRGTKRKMSLRELLEYYLKQNPEDVMPRTITRNRQHAVHLTQLLNDRSPDEIDADAAVDYRNRRSAEGARNRTIKNELAFLKQVLVYGYQSRRITGMEELNLHKLPTIRKQNEPGIALTDDEIKKVMSYRFERDGDRIRRLFVFGIAVMARDFTLRNLEEAEIDEEKAMLEIPAEKMKGRQGEKRRLSVPLPKVALHAVTPKRGRRYVFDNFRGRPAKWPRASIRSMCKETGVRYFTAHDLRRTGRTIYEEAGASAVAIKLLLGHSIAGDVTNESYFRTRGPQLLAETVAKMDEFWERLFPNSWPTCSRDVPTAAPLPPRKSWKTRWAKKAEKPQNSAAKSLSRE